MLSPDLLAQSDPELWNAIRLENQRQEDHVELIASENYVSRQVLIAQGSQLTNKYAEGYPGRRYYGGCEYVDMGEALAIERAKKLFGAPRAHVQPHSGSQANHAGYTAGLKPGETILGLYPSPLGIADFVTTTTHKTLRGPRGGMIFGKPEQEKPINSSIFPGLQGGPLMHVIAAKAVALGEALKPEFKHYQRQVLENARTMAKVLVERGLRVVSGRTDCHLFLLDLRPKHITGKDAEAALGRAHITVNKNAIPNDPQKPAVTSGVRIGSPAMTTRGFRHAEAELLAHLIADVLDNPHENANLERVAGEVKALCARFPVYA